MGIDDFNELKLKMDDFQSKIHQFLIKNNQDLATKSETYWNSESEKIKKIEALKDKLQQLEDHQISLEEELESSQREVSEANAQSKAFLTKRDKLIGEREFLHKELDKLDILLKEQTRDLEREKQSRLLQSSKDTNEVALFETLLGLHISANAQDVITFHFTSRTVDLSPQLSITLDVSQDTYKITDSNPKLPQIIKNDLLNNLAATDDLRNFLKAARSHLSALTEST
ncbi:Spc25 [Kluyveromyces lactis]|nr:Spc25 [Kluyveromyces lactis]